MNVFTEMESYLRPWIKKHCDAVSGDIIDALPMYFIVDPYPLNETPSLPKLKITNSPSIADFQLMDGLSVHWISRNWLGRSEYQKVLDNPDPRYCKWNTSTLWFHSRCCGIISIV